MRVVAEVTAELNLADGVVATFADRVEVSLDCCICHRCWRTIVFGETEFEGRCTPTAHPFPGKIAAKDFDRTRAVYRLEYWYEPFVDAKYPSRLPGPAPNWGRVSFEIVCPKCGESKRYSVQTNTVLPCQCGCRSCGHLLYTEREVMPVLKLIVE